MDHQAGSDNRQLQGEGKEHEEPSLKRTFLSTKSGAQLQVLLWKSIDTKDPTALQQTSGQEG